MSTFQDKVFQELMKVPSGKVTTYKILAEKVGCKSYRAVGQALKRNANAPIIPCHRVVKSNGRIGGYMGKTGPKAIGLKIKLLESEGVKIKNGKVTGFNLKLYC